MNNTKFRCYDREKNTLEPVTAMDWQDGIVITCHTKLRKHYFGFDKDLDPVLMQATGLLDRDGAVIYEGDKASWDRDEGLIERREGHYFWVNIANNKDYEDLCGYSENIVIIGNIYQKEVSND